MATQSQAGSQVPTVFLASSSGGHIDLLVRIASAAEDFRRVFVTQESGHSKALQERGERVELLPVYDRNPFRGKLFTVLARSAKLALRERPRVVITTGTGLVVPFCVFARVLGARIIFVETAARIREPSQSGKLFSRIATLTIVQWPDMCGVYRGAKLCRPSVLDAVSVQPSTQQGSGTFVAVGTHTYPFSRILSEVERAVDAGILPGPVVAQIGVTTGPPTSFDAKSWMHADEIEQGIRDSQYVVCHAGSGLISTALANGKRPMVMARRADRREHYDDHQVETVEALDELGLIERVDDVIDRDAVASIDQDPMPRLPENGAPRIVDELRGALEEPTLWAPAATGIRGGLLRTFRRGRARSGC